MSPENQTPPAFPQPPTQDLNHKAFLSVLDAIRTVLGGISKSFSTEGQSEGLPESLDSPVAITDPAMTQSPPRIYFPNGGSFPK